MWFSKIVNLIRCVLRLLKVNQLCKIASSRTSEACLPTSVCYFMAAIIMVITTYGTFNICGITSHKTSAIRSINIIRNKMQTNGRRILHDSKTWWQKTNLFLELIACSVCTFRWMGEWWENTIRNVGRSGDLKLCLQCDWQVITGLQTASCLCANNTGTNKFIVELK